MDFIIANNADPYEMTHRVAFHLSLPCSIKYPIRVSGIQRVYKGLASLIFGYKSCHILQRIKFVIAFIVEGCHHFCQMMSGFREDYNSFLICQRLRTLAGFIVLQWITEEISLPNFIQFQGVCLKFPIKVYKGSQPRLVLYFDGLSLLL